LLSSENRKRRHQVNFKIDLVRNQYHIFIMPKRILSIQSHVVYGYVGNKSAVFPLQLLGFDVDIINSVHFSNHTGHPHGWEGDVLDGTQLTKLLNGLERNSLLSEAGFLLTGYIGSQSFLLSVKNVLQTLRKKSTSQSSVKYICDPVLGDGGKFYVPPELVQVYKTELIPMADVVTPNQFEVEQLTGISVKTVVDAKLACEKLHNMGPSLVFITSMIINESTNQHDYKDGRATSLAESIAIFASSRSSEPNSTNEMWRIDSPILPGSYTGTGDLCAALILAWTEEHPNDLALAMEKVIGTMHAVIQRTAKASILNEDKKMDSVASIELKLIQSKKDIENPERTFKAKKVL